MYTKTLNVDSTVDLAKPPAHLAVRLQQIKAGTVEVNQNHVSFTGGLFGSGRNRWDILIPFGFGDLTVESNTRQLKYRLSFRQLFVAGTIMVGILTGFFYFAWHSLGGLLAAPIWWIWLVGLNLLIGLPRFEKFVHSAVETAPRTNQ
jgi:hypothetical protein